MRIVSFDIGDRRSYGRIEGDTVIEASEALRGRCPDVRSLLEADAVSLLAEDPGSETHALGGLPLLPPIPAPEKILCVGINYRRHVEETGMTIPEKPVIFVRFPGSLTGHGRPVLCPAVSEKYDYEGELAVVIGRRARHVSRDAADQVIAGYSCFMDGSIRDWQTHTSQFTPGKNFAESGSMGPWLVTRDEVADRDALVLRTLVNGEVMQRGTLSELIFDVPALIEYCSTFIELEPGDVIATGTPGGVGVARKPPVWLKPGDAVAVEIDGVGRLENPVAAG